MNFKDQLKEDLNVFFNPDEFGEDHTIDNKVVNIIIDHDLLKERKAKNADGTYLGDILFFIKKEDFGEEPARGQHVKFDGEIKFVTDCQEDLGMYIITLGANKS